MIKRTYIGVDVSSDVLTAVAIQRGRPATKLIGVRREPLPGLIELSSRQANVTEPGRFVDVLRRAAQKEVTLHPLVAARVLQNLRSDNGEEQPLFTELTERELDVLRLIANGMTNSQIAEKLVISEYTVKGHVSNILSKLHLADRTQVAVYAWQQGLVNRDQMGRK